MTSRARTLAALLLVSMAGEPVRAQRGADGPRVTALATPQANLAPPGLGPGARPQGARPTIMLTGYWPPSNEAIRRFSDDPGKNPNGWIGSNWEHRGYDVYAYFPEFSPANCSTCGQGSGDLEVDYQDTSADFWSLADAIRPMAVITFSRGFGISDSWELEMNNTNHAVWLDDYAAPTQPTPAPPDASVPAGTIRLSTLPVQDVVVELELANVGVDPFICFTQNGGGFLSEFIGYHGVWYQALHADPADPAWCIAAGHVHVSGLIGWPKARGAARATLRTVIRHLDTVRFGPAHDAQPYCATSPNTKGPGAVLTKTGSSSLAAGDLRWLVTDAPPTATGILFFGDQSQATPFGGGTMCIGTPRRRVAPVATTDPKGFLDLAVDLSSAPFSVVAPGGSWNFQFYYRDPTAPGSTVNLSSAVTLTFFP